MTPCSRRSSKPAAPSDHGRRTTTTNARIRPSAISPLPSSPSNPHWKRRPLKARNETKDSPLSRRRTGSQVRSSNRLMSSTFCRTCSSCVACLVIFDPTTHRSSLQRPCRNGSRRLAQSLPILGPEALGRTASSKASTLACATNYSTANSFTRLPKRES